MNIPDGVFDAVSRVSISLDLSLIICLSTTFNSINLDSDLMQCGSVQSYSSR